MNDLTNTVANGDEDDVALIEIGDAVALTEGQGQGSSEDKRRAYNS
ncbi:albusnodin family lasso peptide [Kitasatospora sp. NPDC088783]